MLTLKRSNIVILTDINALVDRLSSSGAHLEGSIGFDFRRSENRERSYALFCQVRASNVAVTVHHLESTFFKLTMNPNRSHHI